MIHGAICCMGMVEHGKRKGAITFVGAIKNRSCQCSTAQQYFVLVYQACMSIGWSHLLMVSISEHASSYTVRVDPLTPFCCKYPVASKKQCKSTKAYKQPIREVNQPATRLLRLADDATVKVKVPLPREGTSYPYMRRGMQTMCGICGTSM